MEERRGEREEPDGDVARAGRRKGQEEGVRHEIVERRPGIHVRSAERISGTLLRASVSVKISSAQSGRTASVKTRAATPKTIAVHASARAGSGPADSPGVLHPGFFIAFESRARASSASSASRYFASAGFRRMASS